MTRSMRPSVVFLLTAAIVAAPALAKDNDPEIELAYTPQQLVGGAEADLAGAMFDVPVELRLTDGRTGENVDGIGTRTDDDDNLYHLTAENDVLGFVHNTIASISHSWGLRIEPQADLFLDGRLLTYSVREQNQPVGATYRAEVRLQFDLRNTAGETLWSGSSYGDATRYGKKFSTANTNEVLSDALLESYADLLSDLRLHDAWAGLSDPIHPGRDLGESVSPQQLLTDLRELLVQGFGTETLVQFVGLQTLTRQMTVNDMTRWRAAKVPEPAIRAALTCPIE